MILNRHGLVEQLFLYLRGEQDASLAQILYEISLSILRIKIELNQVKFLLDISKNSLEKLQIKDLCCD